MQSRYYRDGVSLLLSPFQEQPRYTEEFTG